MAMGSVTATQWQQKARRRRNSDGNSDDGNDGDDGGDGDNGDDDGDGDSDGDKDNGDGNGWQWIPQRRRDSGGINPPMQSSRRIVAVRLRV